MDFFNRANSANLVRIIFGILGFTYLFKQITDEEQSYPLAQWSLVIVGFGTLIVIYGSLLYIFAKRTGQ
jgi:hypothetical protein